MCASESGWALRRNRISELERQIERYESHMRHEQANRPTKSQDGKCVHKAKAIQQTETFAPVHRNLTHAGYFVTLLAHKADHAPFSHVATIRNNLSHTMATVIIAFCRVVASLCHTLSRSHFRSALPCSFVRQRTLLAFYSTLLFTLSSSTRAPPLPMVCQ